MAARTPKSMPRRHTTDGPSREDPKADAQKPRARWQVFGLAGGRPVIETAREPTGLRFPGRSCVPVRSRAFRSHLPLRGSSGFLPDSLLASHQKGRPATSLEYATPPGIGKTHSPIKFGTAAPDRRPLLSLRRSAPLRLVRVPPTHKPQRTAAPVPLPNTSRSRGCRRTRIPGAPPLLGKADATTATPPPLPSARSLPD